MMLLITILPMILQFTSVSCFGRLMEPVSRASAYRKGYSTPFEPDDAYSFNCVGDREDIYLWRKDINGKCGICGDPWMDRPHKLEAPGMFAKGIIFQNYRKGQNITISVDLVENYGGFFMFRLCHNDDFKKDPEQECFNSNVLSDTNKQERFNLTTQDKGLLNFTLMLPNDMTCCQCILQWEYIAGIKRYRACSDISIADNKTSVSRFNRDCADGMSQPVAEKPGVRGPSNAATLLKKQPGIMIAIIVFFYAYKMIMNSKEKI